VVVPDELNMGAVETLVAFAQWGRTNYPARRTLLSIVDHGGGWAPSLATLITDTLPIHKRSYQAGGSGLSWDATSDYDYLDINEMRQALATITTNGAKPLDVVFYDVCLMGMLEVAYELQPYVGFFVSSQNIGWSPIGEEGRYIQMLQGIQPTTTAQEMAALLVKSYADSMPPSEHPFTISAVDLAKIGAVAEAADKLAGAIQQTLVGPSQADTLRGVYRQTQKIDYDSDLRIEPETDGFVDLYDFAQKVAQTYQSNAEVATNAQNLMSILGSAIITEAHRSGTPWLLLDTEVWQLDNTHGLSIFLPFGEDLEYVITTTAPSEVGGVALKNIRLRSTYTDTQLRFVQDTRWDALIDIYYQAVEGRIPAGRPPGPNEGLLRPDVTPPVTVISVTGGISNTRAANVGETVTILWQAFDSQTKPIRATLWHRDRVGQWREKNAQEGDQGEFTYKVVDGCPQTLAVRAIDKAGNVEAIEGSANFVWLRVEACAYLPAVFYGYRTD
jgi:hypothetical protein